MWTLVRKGKKEERNMKAAGPQVSASPPLRQQAQQHRNTCPGRSQGRQGSGRQTAMWERDTEAADPWECDFGDRAVLRCPAPEKSAGQKALWEFTVSVLYHHSGPVIPHLTGVLLRASAGEGETMWKERAPEGQALLDEDPRRCLMLLSWGP